MKRSRDKFGHFRGTGGKPGRPGVGFVLDEEGNFDIQNKNLRNVRDPIAVNDVATMGYVDLKTKKCISYNSEKKAYICDGRLTEVKAPERGSDAVNLSFLKEQTIHKNGRHFDAKKTRICNVGIGEDADDVVTRRGLQHMLEILDKTIIHVNPKTSQFDSINLRIEQVGEAKAKQDAVNLETLKALLKAQAYWLGREIADASIHLRREMHNLLKVKRPAKDIEKHLNDIEQSFKRTWREALQSDGREQSSFSDEEKKQISTHIGVGGWHLNLYLGN